VLPYASLGATEYEAQFLAEVVRGVDGLSARLDRRSGLTLVTAGPLATSVGLAVADMQEGVMGVVALAPDVREEDRERIGDLIRKGVAVTVFQPRKGGDPSLADSLLDRVVGNGFHVVNIPTQNLPLTPEVRGAIVAQAQKSSRRIGRPLPEMPEQADPRIHRGGRHPGTRG
jgi:hypothetical protein